MRRFTIADLLAAGSCEKKLWLRARGETSPDAAEGARSPLPYEAALTFWPECVRVSGDESATSQTLRAAEGGAAAIWGAYAERDDLAYRADALVRREDGGWELCMDANSVHEREALAREAAFAMHVFAASGISVVSAKALLANSEYIRGERLDWSAMYREWDVTDRALSHMRAVKAQAARLGALAESADEPRSPLGEGCLKPRECPLWARCSASLPAPNVFSIAGLSNRRKFQLYRQGVVSYADCMERGKLTRQQRAQALAELRGAPPTVNAGAVRAFLRALWYPMCFLDFESYQPPVPPYEGLRPFEQLAFQYSLHVRAAEGAPLSHHVFLAEPGTDPRPGMAESLAREIPDGACVVVYSSGLEKHVLRALAGRFPEHREKLLSLCASMRDLIAPFRSRAYYAREMRGSCSLKNVLPAMCPDLSYAALEGIRNGEDAMRVYARLSAVPQADRGSDMDRLAAYCSLDTYAMARILDALRAAVGE